MTKNFVNNAAHSYKRVAAVVGLSTAVVVVGYLAEAGFFISLLFDAAHHI